jgi:hypothetical protein
MCERPSKRLGPKFATILFAVIAVLAWCTVSFGQGSEGRTESFDSTSRTRTRTRTPKISFQREISKPKHVDPPPGKLLISVNEPAGCVYLTRTDDYSRGQIPVATTNSSAAITQILDAGSYNLRVKKEGYFDETRSIELSPGERRKVSVSMKPQMALLTLKTNLPDAEIEVERAGTFTKPIKRFMLLPGKYRINLKRRGYVSQTITADLMLAGKEQSFYVVLEPLRIESVLWTASKAIEKGDLAIATDLVRDVLQLNQMHAKANYLYGLIELRRGSDAASSYFLKGIDAGGKTEIPMKLFFSGKPADINLSVDRDTIAFSNDDHLELNFRIARTDVDDIQRLAENSEPQILIKGKSDFYGKTIRPDLRLSLATCKTAVTCSDELDVLYKFLADWRNRTVN